MRRWVMMLAGAVGLAAGPAWGEEIHLSPEPGPAMEAAKPLVVKLVPDSDLQVWRNTTGREPVVGAALADLGFAEGQALLVTVQAGMMTCGHTGCLVAVFRPSGQRWVKVLETYCETVEAVAPTGPNGLKGPAGKPKDLVLNGKARWTWRNGVYDVAGRP